MERLPRLRPGRCASSSSTRTAAVQACGYARDSKSKLPRARRLIDETNPF
jgi:hypothetical protein